MGIADRHGSEARIIFVGSMPHKAIGEQPRQTLLDRKVDLHLETVRQKILAQLIELILHSPTSCRE